MSKIRYLEYLFWRKKKSVSSDLKPPLTVTYNVHTFKWIALRHYLLKNHFRNIRHHLHLKIQTRIMLKSKLILTSFVIGFLAFESCHAFYGVFYRPMLSFIEKPRYFQDHLERRFGKVPATTTQATTTKTTTKIQTVTNPKPQKVKLCHFKTFSNFSCRYLNPNHFFQFKF